MQQPLPEAALVSKLAQDYELPPALQVCVARRYVRLCRAQKSVDGLQRRQSSCCQLLCQKLCRFDGLHPGLVRWPDEHSCWRAVAAQALLQCCDVCHSLDLISPSTRSSLLHLGFDNNQPCISLQAQLLTHMAKKGGGRSSALQQQPQVPPMAPQQAQQGLASLLAHQQGLQGASAPAHQSAGGSMGSALGSTGFGQDFGGGFGFGGMHQQQQRQQVPMQAAGHPMLQQQLQMAGGLAPVQQQLLQRLQAAAQTNPQAAQLLQSVVGDAGSSNLQRHLGAAYPGQGMQQGLDPDTLRVVHALSQQGLASQASFVAEKVAVLQRVAG